jgi:fatty acid amide hydrolase
MPGETGGPQGAAEPSGPAVSEVCQWSASQIAQQIALRRISAVEVLQALIRQIEATHGVINALVLPRLEAALEEARQVDARLARGERRGPLDGVPLSVKECFHVAGLPSTIGLTAAKHQQPRPEDGLLVARLRRAGAIVLGKTNVPQLMIWHESDNPRYGRTNNPWNLARTCGGSSGGEAALIAARGSPLGLGNDLGGSIRIPAHFCGIHGIKPSSLRLPRGGSFRTLRGLEALITQPGPMARSVADLELALRVLADRSDGHVAPDVVPCAPGEAQAVRLQGMRVAVWTDDGVFPPAPAVARAVRQAATLLQQQGLEVVELDAAEVQQHLRSGEAFDLYCSLVAADGGADGRRLAQGSRLDWRVRRLMRIASLSQPLRAVLVAGLRQAGQAWMARLVHAVRPRSADGYWQLVDQKQRLVRHVLTWLCRQRIEALLCPPYALPAPPHVVAYDLLPAASYALLINFLGLPSGTLAVTRVQPGEDQPLSPSRDQVLQQASAGQSGSVGLPVGVQVSALPWREDVVLALMGRLEDAVAKSPEYPCGSVLPAGLAG